jgi:hypothetical protein
VFRPSDGIWYIVDSSTGTPVGIRWGIGGDIPLRGDFDGDGNLAQQWGLSTDLPVSGDFDGDGISDLAVYRPSGYWSSSNFTTYVAQQWGEGTRRDLRAAPVPIRLWLVDSDVVVAHVSPERCDGRAA